MALTSLTRAILVLEAFRKIDKELPTQTALTLLHIAKKPGVSQLELEELTGMGRSSISRQIAFLSTDLGKGYVISGEDIHDRRKKVAKLSPQGELLVAAVRRIIDPDEEF